MSPLRKIHFWKLALLVLCFAPLVHADDARDVRTADDNRIAATLQPDAARLESLLAESLSYGHANGLVQSRTELIQALQSRALVYHSYDYEERTVTPLTDHVALMIGIARLTASAGKQSVAFRLRFLSVWKKTDGQWELHSYQSIRLPNNESD